MSLQQRTFWQKNSFNGCEQPILSIGIPTYNRPDMILGMIEDLIEFTQKYEISSWVEVNICDNCSTNYPQGFIDTGRLKKHGINFIVNRKNLGMSANILKTIEISSGAFYYFVADDERIDLSALCQLVKHLFTTSQKILITKSPESPGYVSENFRGPEMSLSLLQEVDRLNLYYIGNALAVVDTKLLKDGMSRFGDNLLAVQIPQTILTVNAAFAEGSAGYLNLSILRQNLGEEYINKVITSESYLKSGCLLHLEAERILTNHGIRLKKININARHHMISFLRGHFFKFSIILLLLYSLGDSDDERSSFRSTLRSQDFLPRAHYLILEAMVQPFINNILIGVLRGVSRIFPKSRLSNVFRIYSNYPEYKAQMLQKNRNAHNWGQGIGMPD